MTPKPLKDELGVLNKAYKILTEDLHCDFLKALAELEDNENHRKKNFPHTQLHKVSGIKNVSVYRAYINKIQGWKIHLQYGKDNFLYLCDVLTGEEHDDTTEVIMSRKNRYKKKR